MVVKHGEYRHLTPTPHLRHSGCEKEAGIKKEGDGKRRGREDKLRRQRRQRREERSTRGQLSPPQTPAAPDYSQLRLIKALRVGVRVNFTCQHGWAMEPRYLVKYQPRRCCEEHFLSEINN